MGVIPEQPLDEGGGSLDVDVTPYFDDPEGDALIYRAVSSDPDVATVRVAGAVLTLTPVVYGSALVTVTVVRAVLHDTLAAMARSHMASARMTLGRRVVVGGGRRSRLTVLDRSVPLGTAAARQAAERLALGWLSSVLWSGSSAYGLGGSPFGPSGAAPGLGAYPPGGFRVPAAYSAGGFAGPTGGLGSPAGGFGSPIVGGAAAVGMMPGATGGLGGLHGPGAVGMMPGGGLCGLGDLGGGPDAWLHGTKFELALGAGELGRRWSIWGQGDIQTLQDAPTLLGYDAGYDGDVRSGYVGVDAQLTERWLAGVALSRSRGVGDWRVGASRGWLRTTLTALHPYVQWSDGVTSVWTTAGGGWGGGEAENGREATGLVGSSGLGLRLGLVELRRELGAVGGGAELGLRADVGRAGDR